MSSYSYDENPFGDSYGYEQNRQSTPGPYNASSSNQQVGSRATGTDDKIQRNKEQIKDLTNIMKENINKAMERDVNLSELNRNAEDLEFRATDFKRTSTKAKRHFFTKNAKWTVILIIVILIILAIIALIIGLTVANNKKGN